MTLSPHCNDDVVEDVNDGDAVGDIDVAIVFVFCGGVVMANILLWVCGSCSSAKASPPM